MKQINFLFIGPSKTASTWIYKALKEHPDFSLPDVKDIYYFDQFYKKGVNWYLSHFSKCDDSKNVGEFSHDYIYQVDALERIYKFDPDIKLIICLRNPYERTESGIKFLRRNGYGFGNVSDLVEKHHELIDGSLYGRNVEAVLNIFSRDQILFLDFEKLSCNPKSFLNDIYDFFGVKKVYPEFLEKKINEAKSARNKNIAFFAKRLALFLRKMGLSTLVTKLKTNVFLNKVLFKEVVQEETLTQADIDFLSSYFESDIELLEALLERSFLNWKAKNE